MIRKSAAVAAACASVLALSACGETKEETFKTDTADKSGGDLIVADETPEVPVDLPTTEMTPDASATGAAAAPADASAPAPATTPAQ